MLVNGDAATAAAAAVKDTTTKTFAADVLQESKVHPVLVDFWAPWCGPCKQLAPVLEAAVRAAKGRVKLVKMNIDEHPSIAGQLGIQSIPAVIAFSNGQPVDGFMGALPESQVKAFIDRIAGPGGPSEADALLEEGETALAEGDAAGAAEIFAAVLVEDQANARAIAGLAQAQAATGDLAGARRTLGALPADKANDPAVAAARARIELSEQTAALGDLGELEGRLAKDPADHQARLDLAVALASHGKREEALEHLLTIVRRDRAWNDDAARKQLVQLFEAWGPTDPMTVAGRRKLSSVLFS
jgi:putative thioredoxin